MLIFLPDPFLALLISNDSGRGRRRRRISVETRGFSRTRRRQVGYGGRRRDNPGRCMRLLVLTHSMAAAIPPPAIVAIIELPKDADGTREPADFLHRI